MRCSALVGVVGGEAAAVALDRAAAQLSHRGPESALEDGRLRLRLLGRSPDDTVGSREVGIGPSVSGDALPLTASVRWSDGGGELTFTADAYGRRTLYVAPFGAGVAFASELGALVTLLRGLGAPPRLSMPAMRRFFAYSFVPAPHTPWEGLLAVPAGERLRFAVGHLERRILESGTLGSAPPWATDADAPKELFAEALEAVRRAVPSAPSSGLLLSGGLDSALVAAALGRVSRGAVALTLDFEEDSELDAARAIAEASGLVHVAVSARGEDAARFLDAAVERMDTPIGDPVIVPFVIAAHRARELGVTHLLNGEGGDQLFAGWATKPMLAWARYAAPDEDPAPTYLRTFHKLGEIERDALGPALFELGDPPLEDDLRPLLEGDTAARHGHFIHVLCEANLRLKGAGNILPRIDRATASAGLEAVSPLLDPRVVGLSFRLAPDQKQRGTTEKWVLREALRGVLPDRILARPKRGMRVPVRAWLEGPLRSMTHDLLASRVFRERGFFQPEFVASLLADDVRAPDLRRRRRDEWLWHVLFTELWARRHVDAPW